MISDDFLTPPAEVAARLSRLAEGLRAQGAGAALIVQPADLFYFSGTSQSGVLLVPAAGEPVLCAIKSAARARAESPLRVVPVRGFSGLPDALPGPLPARVGLELDVLPVALFQRLQTLFPAARFEDVAPLIRRLRSIKTPHEVEWMRRAGAIMGAALAEVPSFLHEGLRECDFMAELELRLRRGGTPGIVRCRRFGAEISYGTASSGPTANTPWAFDGPVGTPGLYPGMPVGGSRRAIGRGEPILVDYVCSAGGYFVDTSRVFCLGEMPAAAREAHELCGRILRALERLLRPGVPCSRLYQEALELARAGGHADGFMGRGENQVRFVGHGVGLELDELPVLAASFDQPLEAGMTLAVEPKIMLPDAGVGLESTYLVTAGGGESLTPFRAGVEPSN